MDIQKSFSFPFEDPEWISKLGLGAVIAVVPILNFAWTGYMVGIIRNVMQGNARPLPAWDDIGKRFSDGLMLGLASLIYALPILLLMGIPFTILIFSGLLAGNQDLQDISGLLGGTAGLLFPLLGCVLVLYGLALSFIHPAIFLLYTRTGSFASCFDFSGIRRVIADHSSAYLTVWGVFILASMVVGLAVSFVGGIIGWIPCIGWIIMLVLSLGTTVYVGSIFAHLIGQFGRLDPVPPAIP